MTAVAESRPTATTTLGVSGWSALSSAGAGAADFAAAVLAGGAEPVDVAEMFTEALPRDEAYALVDFRVRDHLGRKGTSFLDRSTSLALVACGQAIESSDLVVDDGNRGRVGIVLGTTLGSLKSTSDYSRETLVQDKPYLVNPMQFPNTVMNCAAGQAAIWYKLKGVNATVAGAQLAGISALRYARNQIRRGYVDALLVGSVEELSPHTAWVAEHAYRGEERRVPVGEGAAVFVVEDAAVMRASGRSPEAEILAVEVGQYGPPGGRPDPAAGLARCMRDALAVAGVDAADVWAVATGESGVRALDLVERQAVGQVVRGARCIRVTETVGDSQAASASLQLAAVLAHHRADPELDGRVSLVTACSPDGAVGVAVVRGWCRAARDHG